MDMLPPLVLVVRTDQLARCAPPAAALRGGRMMGIEPLNSSCRAGAAALQNRPVRTVPVEPALLHPVTLVVKRRRRVGRGVEPNPGRAARPSSAPATRTPRPGTAAATSTMPARCSPHGRTHPGRLRTAVTRPARPAQTAGGRPLVGEIAVRSRISCRRSSHDWVVEAVVPPCVVQDPATPTQYGFRR